MPPIPALARARQHLNRCGVGREVTLIITSRLRVPSDFVKALALGANGIALANGAMQAIGWICARNSNNCPAGIATQRPELRARLQVERSADRLNNFLRASVDRDLMKVMARACGHTHLNAFNRDDLATWDWSMARLAGIPFSGQGTPSR